MIVVDDDEEHVMLDIGRGQVFRTSIPNIHTYKICQYDNEEYNFCILFDDEEKYPWAMMMDTSTKIVLEVSWDLI